MRRVPPSMLIGEDLDRMLAEGAGPEENLISHLMELATSLVVLTLVEAEQTDKLGGRGRYQPRDREVGHRGSRNGYVDGSIRTAEGAIPVRVPQVRDTGEPFRSTLLGFLEGNSEVLERLAMGMYEQGHVDSGCGGRLP